MSQSFLSTALSRRAALAGLFGLAACASEPPEAPPVAARKLDAVRLDAEAALAWINAYRARRGLGPVALDPQLNALETRQANAMASADRLSHNVDGGFSARLSAAGLRVADAGENVCAGFYSTEAAMASWAASPEHEANLRMASATQFGVALAKNPRSRYGAFWAMAIAKPA